MKAGERSSRGHNPIRALHALAFLALVAACVHACSAPVRKSSDDDDDDASVSASNSGGAGTTSASTAMGGGPVASVTASTSQSASTGAGTICYDAANALDAPGNSTLVGLNHCTPTQVNAFYTACLDPNTSTMQACTDYQNVNAACASCILPVGPGGNSDGSTPALIPFDDGMGGTLAIVNRFACEAAAQGLPQCGPSLAKYVFCVQTACKLCTTDPDFDICAASADAGVCAQLGNAITTQCEPILQITSFSPQCDGVDFQSLLANVANYFCG
jgi:hypothetical protein